MPLALPRERPWTILSYFVKHSTVDIMKNILDVMKENTIEKNN